MNNEQNIRGELNELLDQGLIEDFKIIKSDINQVRFKLITLEGNQLEVETSVNNCYRIINEEENGNMLYESFEQLLKKHSEKYSTKFGEIVADKLKNLIQGSYNYSLDEE